MRSRNLLRGAALAVAVGILPAWPAQAAPADPSGSDPAASIAAAQDAMSSAMANADRLRGSPAPPTAIDHLRLELQVANAEFAFREAARRQQVAVYTLAADPALEEGALRRLPESRRAGLPDAVQGVRSLWRLAGITDFSRARVRRTRRFMDTEPVDALRGYYRAAASRTGMDWTYLAAINYIESGFGRVNGPSGAGAMGPMQFLPSTWQDYGGGGDIMSSHDSIEAAASFLRRNGAPDDYDRAILRYNRDQDYLEAVRRLAATIRSDPSWLDRLYYWNTFG